MGRAELGGGGAVVEDEFGVDGSGVDGLVVEGAVLVAEEAAVEVDAGGGGGEAAGELGADGGVAEEAVGAGEVTVALGEAVQGGYGGDRAVAPPVVVDEAGQILHLPDEPGGEVATGGSVGSPAVEPGLCDATVAVGGWEEGGEEKGDRDDPDEILGAWD